MSAQIDWPFVICCIIVAGVYILAGVFAQAKSGRTMSTSV